MTSTPLSPASLPSVHKSPRFTLSRGLMYLGLLVAALFFLLPIYLLIVTAFKTPDAINLATTWQLPSFLNWASFSDAWAKVGGNMLNSLFLAVVATAISAMLGSLNGYALSKWKFKGANTLFALMLFGMFIPYQSVLIPLFQFIKSLGLVRQHLGTDSGARRLRHPDHHVDLPQLLRRRARRAGRSRHHRRRGLLGIYAKVIFPISIPGFVVVIIWQFTQVWNEFLFAATLTSSGSQPVTYALSQLAGGQAVSWNLPMAGAILAAIPTLLVYIVLGRYFVRGLLAGSVKG